MARGSMLGDILKIVVGVIIAVMVISAGKAYFSKEKTPSEDSVPPASSESIEPLPEEEFETAIFYDIDKGFFVCV